MITPENNLFRVDRTSSCSLKPCEEAFLSETVVVDMRNCDDPKKIPHNKGTDGDWYERGTNHRVVDGCICRDLGITNAWFVRIDSITEFVKKYGQCVVYIDNAGFTVIEIYDDYRE